ncbi:MAG: antitoxin [Cyanobacteria bacterium P01_H01_bin.21]
MKNEYDFSKSVSNPYTDKLKKQVTIQLEEQVTNYFKQLAAESGISYQNVISLYRKDCMQTQRKLSLQWTDAQ